MWREPQSGRQRRFADEFDSIKQEWLPHKLSRKYGMFNESWMGLVKESRSGRESDQAQKVVVEYAKHMCYILDVCYSLKGNAREHM